MISVDATAISSASLARAAPGTASRSLSVPHAAKAQPVKTSRLQLDYIDGVRAMAALYIVIHHVLMVTGPQRPGLAVRPFAYGQEVVAMFITISGFCLALPQAMKSDWKVDAGRYYVRRARRILPPYYAAVALGTAGMALRTRWGDTFPATAVLEHLLLLQNWFTADMFQVNGPLWSVALECQIYLLFPLLILLRKKLGMLPTLAAATGSAFLSFHLLGGVGQTHFLAFFAMGIFFAELAFQPERQRWLPWVMTAGVVGLVAGEFYREHVAQEFCAVFIGAVLAYLLGERSHPVRRMLSWKPLTFVGIFSYSIYLVHGLLMEPVGSYMRWKDPGFGVRNDWQHLSVMGGTALLSIVFAYGFHRVVERPFMSAPRKAVEARVEAL